MMHTGIEEVSSFFRKMSKVSIPDLPGMERSSVIKSGFSDWASLMASSPLVAVITDAPLSSRTAVRKEVALMGRLFL